MTCDKWVLSGVCGIGKPTLFPFDYINRQENGTRGEWLEFHSTSGRLSFSLVFFTNDKETRGGVLHTVWSHTRMALTSVFSADCAQYGEEGKYLKARVPLCKHKRAIDCDL